MAMDRSRLKKPLSSAQTVDAAPVVTVPAGEPAATVPAPVTSPAPTPVAGGQPFTGLDPMTLSLVEAAPKVPAASRSTPLPPTQSVQQPRVAASRRLKSPTLLVAAGGALAAGLLLLVGARSVGHRISRAGYPSAAAPANVSAPTVPQPPISLNDSWLTAGGTR